MHCLQSERLNLSNGLKSISTKQFLDIVAHFYCIASGETLKINRLGDCETQILNFIRLLKYPTSISKSFLKAPNAPHLYSECVALLAFMCDLTIDDSNDNLLDAFYSTKCVAEFPTDGFMEFLAPKLRTAFDWWSSASHAVGKYKKWVDETAQGAVLLSLAEPVHNNAALQMLVDGMKKRIEELERCEREKDSVKRCEQAEHLEALREIGARGRSLKKKSAIRSNEIEKLEWKYSEKQDKIEDKKNDIRHKQQIISMQRTNVDEFRSAKSKFTELHETIKSKQKELQQLKGHAETNQLQKARLIKQKMDAITKLNRNSSKVIQTALSSKMDIAFDVNDMQVDSNATKSAIHSMCRRMLDLVTSIENNKLEIERRIEQKNSKLEELKSLQLNFSKSSEAAKNHLRKISEQLCDATKAFNERRESGEKSLRESEEKRQQLVEELDALEKEVAACNGRCELLKQTNINLVAEGERKAAELFETKLMLIEQMDELIEKVDKIKK